MLISAAFGFALISSLGYNLMQTSLKGLGRNTHALFLPSLLGLAAPVLCAALLLWLWLGHEDSRFSATYALWLVLFAAFCAATLYINAGLAQRLPLSSLSAYKKVGSLLLAAMADIFWLAAPFNGTALLGLLPFGAAIFLLQSRQTTKQPRNRQQALKTLATIATLTLCSTAALACYKHAQAMQPSLTTHILIAQTSVASLYLLVYLAQLRSNASLRRQPGLYIPVVLFVVASVIEGYALGRLSITELLMISTLAGAVFGIYDVRQGDLHLNRKTVFAFALMIISLFFIAWSKQTPPPHTTFSASHREAFFSGHILPLSGQYGRKCTLPPPRRNRLWPCLCQPADPL